jgi:hypothetical protein
MCLTNVLITFPRHFFRSAPNYHYLTVKGDPEGSSRKGFTEISAYLSRSLGRDDRIRLGLGSPIADSRILSGLGRSP